MCQSGRICQETKHQACDNILSFTKTVGVIVSLDLLQKLELWYCSTAVNTITTVKHGWGSIMLQVLPFRERVNEIQKCAWRRPEQVSIAQCSATTATWCHIMLYGILSLLCRPKSRMQETKIKTFNSDQSREQQDSNKNRGKPGNGNIQTTREITHLQEAQENRTRQQTATWQKPRRASVKTSEL